MYVVVVPFYNTDTGSSGAQCFVTPVLNMSLARSQGYNLIARMQNYGHIVPGGPLVYGNNSNLPTLEQAEISWPFGDEEEREDEE